MFSQIIFGIGRWITGGGLSGIADQLRRAHADKLAAGNDSDRIAADVLIDQLTLQQRVLIEETRHATTRMIRPAFVAPFIFYNAKFLIWDKALQLGASDSMGPEFWNLQMLMVGFYFLGRPVEKGLAKFSKRQ